MGQRLGPRGPAVDDALLDLLQQDVPHELELRDLRSLEIPGKPSKEKNKTKTTRNGIEIITISTQ